MSSIFRINDVIDLPVLDRASGQRLCTVKDIIIDLRENRIYALICRQRFISRTIGVVPFSNVSSISQNGVFIKGKLDQISARKLYTRYRRFQSYQCILGKLVQNTRGETVGVIRDLVIDTRSGIIKGYELSEGYLDDLFGGRHIIEFDCNHTLTGKYIVQAERD